MISSGPKTANEAKVRVLIEKAHSFTGTLCHSKALMTGDNQFMNGASNAVIKLKLWVPDRYPSMGIRKWDICDFMCAAFKATSS